MNAKPETTKVIERLATIDPEQRFEIHRTKGAPTNQAVYHLYRERLQEVLLQALRQGYAGVDITHLQIEEWSSHSKLDVWQARKWTEEMPDIDTERTRRYDFRYYDRKRLITILESTRNREKE